jgi:hypothetical protein
MYNIHELQNVDIRYTMTTYVICFQVLIKSNRATTALSTMALPLSEVTVQIDTIEVVGPATIGFLARPETSTPILNAHVGRIIGNAQSLVRVDEHITLFWGTRVGYVNLLRINTNVYVKHNGKLDLPKTVIIDKGWSVDVCGTITSNVNEMIVREKGALKMSHPASDLQINTLVIDYEGRLQETKYCGTLNEKVTLQLTHFNRTPDFILDTSKFVLSASFIGNVSMIGVMGNETECPLNRSIYLERGQYCTLPPGEHTYTSITISPGAELRLDGRDSAESPTTIKADNIFISFDGVITGVGKGYQVNGPGSPLMAGQGATHAGKGVGNTKNTYGNMKSPTEYGSNGHGATLSSGRGGGQVKIVVTDTLHVEGRIDMSADSGEGGSGGSIFVEARKIIGDGYMIVDGGKGGGGGRIAAVATHTYSFTGTLSAEGQTSSGKTGSSGMCHFLCAPSFLLFIFFTNRLKETS